MRSSSISILWVPSPNLCITSRVGTLAMNIQFWISLAGSSYFCVQIKWQYSTLLNTALNITSLCFDNCSIHTDYTTWLSPYMPVTGPTSNWHGTSPWTVNSNLIANCLVYRSDILIHKMIYARCLHSTVYLVHTRP